MVGTTLSHYKILSELGRGGMGIVYKAEDTKLERTVAIKVLPSSALASEDDRARFYREAKAAAQLHHPHIASVFEIDEAVPSDAPHGTQPSPFIAMEYIEGQTLDALVKQGPIDLSEAVRIASEVASALETAHEKDIVHRDIKTGNVMLTGKGVAKVLDFGLAQTAQSTKLTTMGSTLGTIAYMSPEQARGEEVDGRSDLWSLGVVLFEMLVGRLPFSADYEQAAIYSILNEDPEPITALRTGVPMDLEFLVGKLLTKDARHRYQNAAGLIADLSAIRESAPSRISSQTTIRTSKSIAAASNSKTGFQFSPAVTIVAITTAIGLAGILLWNLATPDRGQRTPTEQPVMRLTLQLPAEHPLAFVGGSVLGVEFPALSISADGRRLVYVSDSSGTSQLVIHEMNSRTYRVLPETENAYHPVFSPDGEWVAYLAGGELRRISIRGGRSDVLASVSDPNGLLWPEEGWIYFVNSQGLDLRRVTPAGALDQDILPIPDRANLLGTGIGGMGLTYSVFSEREIVQYENETATRIGITGANPNYLPTGHLVYTSTGRLLATRFDPGTLRNITDARTVLDNLRTSSILGAGQYAFSQTGTLVYAGGGPADVTRLILRSPDGTIWSLPFESGIYGSMDITRDDNRVVVQMTDGTDRILVMDIGRGTSQTFLQGPGAFSPIWTPDATGVVYGIGDSTGFRLMVKRVNSARPAEELLAADDALVPYDWSPDGRFLVYSKETDNAVSLYVRDTMEGTDASIEAAAGFRLWGGAFSPDGKYIAYTTVGGTGSEILVEPFPLTGERWNVSAGIAEEPEWRGDTNELVFRRGSDWMSVSIQTEPSFTYEAPRKLFEGPYVNISGMEYRVLSDGSVLLQEPLNTNRTTEQIEVVVNWFSELNEIVPVQQD